VTRIRFRAPQIEVRAGSYDFDNTNHIFSGRYTGTRFDGSFPLDDSYPALRDALWLATDTAYKTAVESMSRKRATLNAAAAQGEKLPDFAHAEPVKSIAKLTHRKIDERLDRAHGETVGAVQQHPGSDGLGVILQLLEAPPTW